MSGCISSVGEDKKNKRQAKTKGYYRVYEWVHIECE